MAMAPSEWRWAGQERLFWAEADSLYLGQVFFSASSRPFYEKTHRVKTESPQWHPARKRFNLLFAAHCLADPGRSEHGIGSRGGIFSGSRVKTAL
jgi:hypothetical protein